MSNISSILHDECLGCEACWNICPKHAITMKMDQKGFWHPQIDSAICINCGKCYQACPVRIHTFNEKEQSVFALTLKDEKIKRRSSSGGAFYWLASSIIARGGTIYGAAFDPISQSVKHIRVESEARLKLLQSSKYVQSRIGDCYFQAKGDLEEGKLVLFSGTPCQIAGLYSYLGIKYEKLYTCDILCYGVPSPIVFEKYLKEIVDDSAVFVNMRDKEYGWVKYSMYVETEKSSYRKEKTKDIYQLGFQTNLLYRDCCFNCQFRKTNRIGDITLGDFWLFKESFQRGSIRNNDTGISFFMINNEKAEDLFNELDKSQIIYEKRDLNDNARNYGFGKKMEVEKDREIFFKSLETHSYSEAISHYIDPNHQNKVSISKKVYRALKKSYNIRKLLHSFGIQV